MIHATIVEGALTLNVSSWPQGPAVAGSKHHIVWIGLCATIDSMLSGSEKFNVKSYGSLFLCTSVHLSGRVLLVEPAISELPGLSLSSSVSVQDGMEVYVVLLSPVSEIQSSPINRSDLADMELAGKASGGISEGESVRNTQGRDGAANIGYKAVISRGEIVSLMHARMDADGTYREQICAAYRLLSEAIGCELRMCEIMQRSPNVFCGLLQESIRQQSDDRATAIQMLDILSELTATASVSSLHD